MSDHEVMEEKESQRKLKPYSQLSDQSDAALAYALKDAKRTEAEITEVSSGTDNLIATISKISNRIADPQKKVERAAKRKEERALRKIARQHVKSKRLIAVWVKKYIDYLTAYKIESTAERDSHISESNSQYLVDLENRLQKLGIDVETLFDTRQKIIYIATNEEIDISAELAAIERQQQIDQMRQLQQDDTTDDDTHMQTQPSTQRIKSSYYDDIDDSDDDGNHNNSDNDEPQSNAAAVSAYPTLSGGIQSHLSQPYQPQTTTLPPHPHNSNSDSSAATTNASAHPTSNRAYPSLYQLPSKGAANATAKPVEANAPNNTYPLYSVQPNYPYYPPPNHPYYQRPYQPQASQPSPAQPIQPSQTEKKKKTGAYPMLYTNDANTNATYNGNTTPNANSNKKNDNELNLDQRLSALLDKKESNTNKNATANAKLNLDGRLKALLDKEESKTKPSLANNCNKSSVYPSLVGAQMASQKKAPPQITTLCCDEDDDLLDELDNDDTWSV